MLRIEVIVGKYEIKKKYRFLGFFVFYNFFFEFCFELKCFKISFIFLKIM